MPESDILVNESVCCSPPGVPPQVEDWEREILDSSCGNFIFLLGITLLTIKSKKHTSQ